MFSLLLMLITAPIEVNWNGYEYYRPIKDNFLFRPLGWTKPDLTPRYELIGTIVGEDFARGYIINVRNNRIRIVEVGSVLDNNNVVSNVSRNKIRMNDGKEYVTKDITFLNTKKRGRNQEILPLKLEIVRTLHQKRLRKRIQEYDKELVGDQEEQEVVNGKHR